MQITMEIKWREKKLQVRVLHLREPSIFGKHETKDWNTINS